jgi:hypothetical protein
MLTFTLDTNCVIAIEEGRTEASAIRTLAEAHASGLANVALVAISASERQKNGGPLGSFTQFTDRIAALGLSHLDLLWPMMYWDVTFWDACLWVEPNMLKLETEIQNILFPNIPVSWLECCRKLGPDADLNIVGRKWKNAKCDVQGYWCHAYRRRDVFVTSDRNFHAASRKARLIKCFGGQIELPGSAAALIRSAQSAP